MGRGYAFWERLTESGEMSAEAISGLPILELAGEHRVLIENHFGVKAYSRESIAVKVRFGLICVCGTGLELMKMTREQLVIRGNIEGISLKRGRQA